MQRKHLGCKKAFLFLATVKAKTRECGLLLGTNGWLLKGDLAARFLDLPLELVGFIFANALLEN